MNHKIGGQATEIWYYNNFFNSSIEMSMSFNIFLKKV